MNTVETIRQEIERRSHGEQGFNSEDAEYGYRSCARDLLSLLDTLSEEPDKSLEEAAENYIAPIENDEGLDYINFNGRDIKDAFKAGAEWQKQHDAELIEIAYNDGITIGMTKQKEQMLKEAVEGFVNYYEDSGGKLMAEAQVGCPYHIGDKVRIVVLKEEGE